MHILGSIAHTVARRDFFKYCCFYNIRLQVSDPVFIGLTITLLHHSIFHHIEDIEEKEVFKRYLELH